MGTWKILKNSDTKQTNSATEVQPTLDAWQIDQLDWVERVRGHANKIRQVPEQRSYYSIVLLNLMTEFEKAIKIGKPAYDALHAKKFRDLNELGDIMQRCTHNPVVLEDDGLLLAIRLRFPDAKLEDELDEPVAELPSYTKDFDLLAAARVEPTQEALWSWD